MKNTNQLQNKLSANNDVGSLRNVLFFSVGFLSLLWGSVGFVLDLGRESQDFVYLGNRFKNSKFDVF